MQLGGAGGWAGVQLIALLYFAPFFPISSAYLPTKVALFLSRWLRYFHVCLKRVGKVKYPGERGKAMKMKREVLLPYCLLLGEMV